MPARGVGASRNLDWRFHSGVFISDTFEFQRSPLVIRRFLSSCAMVLTLGTSLDAQQRPVVVELFTSQGCSSCPAADAYLQDLTKREDVIALALHVDYWDYIGWPDAFARPEWTERQRDYAKASGQKMIYTPQMVINGQNPVVGNRVKDVEALIERHGNVAVVVRLGAVRQGDIAKISARVEAENQGPFKVQLIRYLPHAEVDIARGENAGKRISYVNIVEALDVIGTWDGKEPLALEVPLAGDAPAVIVIQKQGHGPIVAAALVE